MNAIQTDTTPFLPAHSGPSSAQVLADALETMSLAKSRLAQVIAASRHIVSQAAYVYIEAEHSASERIAKAQAQVDAATDAVAQAFQS